MNGGTPITPTHNPLLVGWVGAIDYQPIMMGAHLFGQVPSFPYIWGMIILIIVSVLLLTAFTSAIPSFRDFHLLIYLKNFNNPYFFVGISHSREEYPDECIDVVEVGFFFFGFQFDFHKLPDQK